MADAFAELLDLIVRDYAITDAQKDVDLNAPADEPATVIEADKRHIVSEAAERARAMFPSFRTGLLLAFEAQGARPGMRFDSTIVTQSKMPSPML